MADSTKTMLQIITMGYKRLGLLRHTETLSAAEAQDGLDAANGMIHNWRNYGVDITHTDKALADTFPLDEKFDEGFACMLAVKMADENGDQAGAQTRQTAYDCWKSLLAEYLTTPDEATFDAVLVHMPSQRLLTGVSN